MLSRANVCRLVVVAVALLSISSNAAFARPANVASQPHAAPAKVMNDGGVPYMISNPPSSTPNWQGTPGTYVPDFDVSNVEHFDVYGEVRSKYSQVYWTRNNPIELPPALVERFKGKVMVITGYEVDQVVHTDVPANTSTRGDVLGGFSCYPDCSASDTSIPIYNQYNHHYYGWLVNADTEVVEGEATRLPNPTKTLVRDRPHNYVYPTNIVFKENPGGEFRKSYHGYPRGYGQFIYSPTQWLVEPMQIDTHNRDYPLTATVGYKPAFLPKMDDNNMTDLHSGLSPLIECPCTDRIKKIFLNTSAVIISGTCPVAISSAAACADAVAAIAPLGTSTTVKDTTLPSGCIMTPSTVTSGAYNAIFNTAVTSNNCGGGGDQQKLAGEAYLASLVNMSIAHDGTTAHITLAGPAGVWFGVGFDAQVMADAPYGIIVDGSGNVTERKLANHDPGTLLASTITVVSNNVLGGIRTVVLTRSVHGASADYFSLPTDPGFINVITAVGNTPQLAYHRAKGAARIALLPTVGDMCVCTPVTKTYLSYMNQPPLEYSVYCADEPRSDMLRHGDGTGQNVENAACNMETYHGGLHCCVNQYFLTDLEQDALIPNATDVYFLKWRYYFEEYVPPTGNIPASHKHLHHWVFLIDEAVNDYEEDNLMDRYGTPSIGKITAHITAAQMGLEDTPASYKLITPMVMTPHCHAPDCIREELWNAATGEIICNVTANYGSSAHGSTADVFNEENYIAIPPCIFGFQPGVQFPFNLTASTPLTAIKYFNNTYRHLGQMAQWTGLMVYDTDLF